MPIVYNPEAPAGLDDSASAVGEYRGAQHSVRGTVTIHGHTYEYISGGQKDIGGRQQSTPSGTWDISSASAQELDLIKSYKDKFGMHSGMRDKGKRFDYVLENKAAGISGEEGFRIHPANHGVDPLQGGGTEGCIGIIGHSPEEYQNFVNDMETELKQHGGHYKIHVVSPDANAPSAPFNPKDPVGDPTTTNQNDITEPADPKPIAPNPTLERLDTDIPSQASSNAHLHEFFAKTAAESKNFHQRQTAFLRSNLQRNDKYLT